MELSEQRAKATSKAVELQEVTCNHPSVASNQTRAGLGGLVNLLRPFTNALTVILPDACPNPCSAFSGFWALVVRFTEVTKAHRISRQSTNMSDIPTIVDISVFSYHTIQQYYKHPTITTTVNILQTDFQPELLGTSPHKPHQPKSPKPRSDSGRTYLAISNRLDNI